jgi:hypothetical protein
VNQAHSQERPWRIGRKVARNMYVQLNDDGPSDADPMVAVTVGDPVLAEAQARLIVAAVNNDRNLGHHLRAERDALVDALERVRDVCDRWEPLAQLYTDGEPIRSDLVAALSEVRAAMTTEGTHG